MYLQTCPRCGTGTLLEEADIWGRSLNCLHCGFILYLEEDEDAETALATVSLRSETTYLSSKTASSR